MTTAYVPPDPPRTLRVDPITGSVEDFGHASVREVGDWDVVGSLGSDGTYEMLAQRPDSETIVLGDGDLVGGSSDRLYVKNTDRQLRRFGPGDSGTVLAKNVCHADIAHGFAIEQLFVTSGLGTITGPDLGTGPCPAWPVYRLSLIDGTTGAERVIEQRASWLAGGPGRESLSADGSKFALVVKLESGELQIRVVSFDGTQEQTIDLPPAPPDPNSPDDYCRPVWRPGSDELWCMYLVRPSVLVLSPRHGLVEIDRRARLQPMLIGVSKAGGGIVDPTSIQFAEPSRNGTFTSDGRFWLSGETDAEIHLNDASDLSSAEGIALPGKIQSLIEIEPGVSFVARQEISAPTGNDSSRTDLYYHEPWNGTSRLLAENVDYEVVYGRTRVLALSRRVGTGRGGGGDLAIFDLASGERTLIAQNVTGFALAPCDGCDPLDPGTPVVYSVHAPHPYQYDGVWVGALP